MLPLKNHTTQPKMDIEVFESSELEHQHEPVKLVALRKLIDFQIAGDNFGTIEETTEFQAPLWIAEELIQNGIARLAAEKESLTIQALQKIQILETMQPVNRFASVPANFYPKVKRFLNGLKSNNGTDPVKLAEYQKAVDLARDIVTARVNKTLRLAASGPVENVPQNLTLEEKQLLDTLAQSVSNWFKAVTRFLEG